MTHTIRAYHKGKKAFEATPDQFDSLEEIVEGLKSRLLDGSADFIEIIDHTNARKSRRIYAMRKKQ